MEGPIDNEDDIVLEGTEEDEDETHRALEKRGRSQKPVGGVARQPSRGGLRSASLKSKDKPVRPKAVKMKKKKK